MSKIAKEAQIEIFGWIMHRKLSAGRYRVEKNFIKEFSRYVYTFYRPRGKKIIVRHFIDPFDAWIRDANSEDLNKVVILSEVS